MVSAGRGCWVELVRGAVRLTDPLKLIRTARQLAMPMSRTTIHIKRGLPRFPVVSFLCPDSGDSLRLFSNINNLRQERVDQAA